MTSKQQVQHHLDTHGYVTIGAMNLTYGRLNGLAQRIHDLRNDGVAITTTTKKDDSGRSYVRYELAS